MAEEFSVKLVVSEEERSGRLEWESTGEITEEILQRTISLAADEAIFDHELRRVTAAIIEGNEVAKIALHRCGFRLEGRLRQAAQIAKEEYRDVLLYARLATDIVYGSHGFSGVMDSVLPKKRVLAHAVFVNEAEEVLLLETNYKEDWNLPGGVVEPKESPREGAQREITEEIGISVLLKDPVLIDWMPASLGWGDAVEFIFWGGRMTPEQTAAIRCSNEIKAHHWVAIDDIDEKVSEICARQLRLMYDSKRGYSENGLLIES